MKDYECGPETSKIYEGSYEPSDDNDNELIDGLLQWISKKFVICSEDTTNNQIGQMTDNSNQLYNAVSTLPDSFDTTSVKGLWTDSDQCNADSTNSNEIDLWETIIGNLKQIESFKPFNNLKTKDSASAFHTSHEDLDSLRHISDTDQLINREKSRPISSNHSLSSQLREINNVPRASVKGKSCVQISETLDDSNKATFTTQKLIERVVLELLNRVRISKINRPLQEETNVHVRSLISSLALLLDIVMNKRSILSRENKSTKDMTMSSTSSFSTIASLNDLQGSYPLQTWYPPLKKTWFYKTKMCPSLQRNGFCFREDKCSFAHSFDELRPQPLLQKTKICYAWRQGFCTRSDCKFAHGTHELCSVEIPWHI